MSTVEYGQTLAEWRAQYTKNPHIVSSVLTRYVSQFDRADNAWIYLASEQDILTQCAALLDALEDGSKTLVDMPLFGVPFAVKDNIDVAGMPTTAACPAFLYHPEVDARLLPA